MTPVQKLIYEAVKFSNWAAGEGLCPAEGEDARAPDEFLLEYADATGDEDWEAFAYKLAMEVGK